MSQAMKLGAIAPWFGAKRTIAPAIIAQLGAHRAYWEPFCGSLAVLLAKQPCSYETVNDLHGDLINLARVIKHPLAGPAFYRRVRRVLFGRAMVGDARDVLATVPLAKDLLSIDRAEAYFVDSWQGMNGLAGTERRGNGGISRRFSSSGGSTSIRFQSAVESIPAWRKRLRDVVIENDDGFALLEKIEDREGTVIYADPPYLTKGAKYQHDFADADHARLADLLGRFKRTRVVVSYYEHPRLAELYRGWSKAAVAATKSIVNQGKRDSGGATAAPEVLMVNGALMGAQLF